MRESFPSRSALRSALAGVLALMVAGTDALAFGSAPLPTLSQMLGGQTAESDATGDVIELAQGGCSAAAAQAAAQSGGQVLSVQTSQQGGRTVCIVTVLVPGRDGSRPRRQTITVPQ